MVGVQWVLAVGSARSKIMQAVPRPARGVRDAGFLPGERRVEILTTGHLAVPVPVPYDVNWPAHRIASTNQHPTSMGTK